MNQDSTSITVEIVPFVEVPGSRLRDECRRIRPQEYHECKAVPVRGAFQALCTRFRITRGLTKYSEFRGDVRDFSTLEYADSCMTPDGFSSGVFRVPRTLIRYPEDLVLTNVPKEVCFAQPIESRLHPIRQREGLEMGQRVQVRRPFPRRVCEFPGSSDSQSPTNSTQ